MAEPAFFSAAPNPQPDRYERPALTLPPADVLSIFDFDGHPIRVIARDDEPWFVAADVCGALKLSNARVAVQALDDDEKGVSSTDTPGGRQNVTVVTEGGLWTLVLRCRDATKPGTLPHRFRKWVTADVIPAIRTSGHFHVKEAPLPPDLNDPTVLRNLLLTHTEKVIALQGQVAEQEPKVQALERIAESDGSFCITDAAKTLQVRPKDLFGFLRANGWIYTRPGTSHEVAYQARLVDGSLEHKTTTVLRADGSERVCTQVRVTPKGLTKLAVLLQPALRSV